MTLKNCVIGIAQLLLAQLNLSKQCFIALTFIKLKNSEKSDTQIFLLM